MQGLHVASHVAHTMHGELLLVVPECTDSLAAQHGGGGGGDTPATPPIALAELYVTSEPAALAAALEERQSTWRAAGLAAFAPLHTHRTEIGDGVLLSVRQTSSGGAVSVRTAVHEGVRLQPPCSSHRLIPAVCHEEQFFTMRIGTQSCVPPHRFTHRLRWCIHGTRNCRGAAVVPPATPSSSPTHRVQMLRSPHQAGLPPTVDVRVVLDAVMHAAQALELLHLSGHTHGDICDATLLFSTPPDGSAAMISFATLGRIDAGTPAAECAAEVRRDLPVFIAPEVAAGSTPCSHAADVWALAMVLIYCLRPHLPHVAEGPLVRLVNLSPVLPPPPPTRPPSP